jgi:acetyl-CoA decarbonylase/synthase, CODH/ACS complex subunit gamma
MALTGLQIQKLLPKTNCRECGSNTCMAFAMRLAARKADLSLCPYASEEAKTVLGAAAEPPVRDIGLRFDNTLRVGGETVLYRHEKTFVHQTVLAVNINDTDSSENIERTLNAIKDYALERVGETMRIDMVSITHQKTNAPAFIELVRRVHSLTGLPLVVRSCDPQLLIEVSAAMKGSACVLSAATPETTEKLGLSAEENGHTLAVTASDVDEMAACTQGLRESGFSNLLLQFQTSSPAEQFQTNTVARRAALKDGIKPMGYPFLHFIDSSENLLDIAAEAATEILKYGGICVLPFFDPALLATLMTLRLNIFTDPQKPIQVEPKIYPIGEPGIESPVFVTTNFALTYFIVSGELENCGIGTWLVVPECDGMSVLTAWAAGKFSGTSIARFIKESGLEDRIKTRTITIPGYVSVISGEMEENLPGWKVLIGPQDASDLDGYIKAILKEP